jgi:hypothetical protein
MRAIVGWDPQKHCRSRCSRARSTRSDRRPVVSCQMCDGIEIRRCGTNLSLDVGRRLRSLCRSLSGGNAGTLSSSVDVCLCCNARNSECTDNECVHCENLSVSFPREGSLQRRTIRLQVDEISRQLYTMLNIISIYCPTLRRSNVDTCTPLWTRVRVCR